MQRNTKKQSLIKRYLVQVIYLALEELSHRIAGYKILVGGVEPLVLGHFHDFPWLASPTDQI